jgi:DNA excision repair protein ERCC-4
MSQVIVDVHEPVKIVEGIKNAGIECEVQALPVGDYLVKNFVLIERKTVFDLIASIKDGRLKGEIKTMAQEENIRPILLIEGSLGLVQKLTRFPINAVLSTLSSVMVYYGVPCLVVPSQGFTIMFITNLVNFLSKTPESVPTLRETPYKKGSSPKEVAINILTGFPQIGVRSAEALIEKFNTIADIINADDVKLLEAGLTRPAAASIFTFSRLPIKEADNEWKKQQNQSSQT